MSPGGTPRLLFDQNLAHRLVKQLHGLYPGSLHVRDVGLASAGDTEIWDYAAAHGLVIVTKDDDFRQRSIVRGAPPHVVWLRVGNCRTSEIETLLSSRVESIRDLMSDPEGALLILTRLR